MQEFLDQFAAPIGKDEHVVLVLDQAGWHGAHALRVPASITLVPLPPYSPELNPVEWVWEYMKERFPSLRLHNDYDAIADAACKAWNRLRAETGRITSLCSHPWIMEVKPLGPLVSLAGRNRPRCSHASGYLNERGQPFHPKSVKAMIDGPRPADGEPGSA
jgi:transposase